jgi:hypothetical protein
VNPLPAFWASATQAERNAAGAAFRAAHPAHLDLAHGPGER